MYQIDPVFGERNGTTGVFEWFYESGGVAHGPFPTNSRAMTAYVASRHPEAENDNLAVGQRFQSA